MTGDAATEPIDRTRVGGPVPPLLVIAGATATGKTGLSLAIADALRTEGQLVEILSADSRQVYRGLDIGTAKVGRAERARIPHHGLDLVDPDVRFSVAAYARAAAEALEGIGARGALAILVGGTGLYLRAVARGVALDAFPADPAVRAALEADLAAGGLPGLVERLVARAPCRASRTDVRNPRRVIRALEVALLVGDGPPIPPLGYPGASRWLGLATDPARHREWIEDRAREQFAAGLIEEARALRERWEPTLPAFSAIGYHEAWSVIDGSLDLEGAIELDARRNVAFARRQRTWFRAEPGIDWLDAADEPLRPALETARRLLAEASRPARVS